MKVSIYAYNIPNSKLPIIIYYKIYSSNENTCHNNTRSFLSILSKCDFFFLFKIYLRKNYTIRFYLEYKL